MDAFILQATHTVPLTEHEEKQALQSFQRNIISVQSDNYFHQRMCGSLLIEDYQGRYIVNIKE